MSDKKIEIIGELNINKVCEVLSLILGITVTAKKGVVDEKQN